MELLVESFPTESAMNDRRAILESGGVKIAYVGIASSAKDLLVRVWDSSGNAKTQVVDLVNGFVLITAPA